MEASLCVKSAVFWIAASLVLHYSFAAKCTRLDFSQNVPSDVHTVQGHSTVTMNFTFPDDCSSDDVKKIWISKDRYSHIICQILLTGERCIPSKYCACERKAGRWQFRLSKLVDLSDSGVYRWYIDRSLVREIHFNVLSSVSDLATVHNMTVLSGDGLMHSTDGDGSILLQQNASISIICSWKDGNPPVQAVLLNSKGDRLQIRRGGNSFHYTIPAITCQQAGLYRCQAQGAMENKTVKLLVKCPPNFSEETSNGITISVKKGHNATLPVRVCAHTTEISSCRLSRETDTHFDAAGLSFSKDQYVPCKSFSTLTGSPPDLKLRVLLSNVDTKDSGKWTLTLSNEVGSSQLDFYIDVVPELAKDGLQLSGAALPQNTSKGAEPSRSGIGDFLASITTGAIVSAGILFVATVIAIVSVCVWRGKRRNTSRRRRRRRNLPGDPGDSYSDEENVPVLSPTSERGQKSGSDPRQSVHLYEEVDNRPVHKKHRSGSVPIPCTKKTGEKLGPRKPTIPLPATPRKTAEKRVVKASPPEDHLGYLRPVFKGSRKSKIRSAQKQHGTHKSKSMPTSKELPSDYLHAVSPDHVKATIKRLSLNASKMKNRALPAIPNTKAKTAQRKKVKKSGKLETPVQMTGGNGNNAEATNIDGTQMAQFQTTNLTQTVRANSEETSPLANAYTVPYLRLENCNTDTENNDRREVQPNASTDQANAYIEMMNDPAPITMLQQARKCPLTGQAGPPGQSGKSAGISVGHSDPPVEISFANERMVGPDGYMLHDPYTEQPVSESGSVNIAFRNETRTIHDTYTIHSCYPSDQSDVKVAACSVTKPSTGADGYLSPIQYSFSPSNQEHLQSNLCKATTQGTG